MRRAPVPASAAPRPRSARLGPRSPAPRSPVPPAIARPLGRHARRWQGLHHAGRAESREHVCGLGVRERALSCVPASRAGGWPVYRSTNLAAAAWKGSWRNGIGASRTGLSRPRADRSCLDGRSWRARPDHAPVYRLETRLVVDRLITAGTAAGRGPEVRGRFRHGVCAGLYFQSRFAWQRSQRYPAARRA